MTETIPHDLHGRFPRGLFDRDHTGKTQLGIHSGGGHWGGKVIGLIRDQSESVFQLQVMVYFEDRFHPQNISMIISRVMPGADVALIVL